MGEDAQVRLKGLRERILANNAGTIPAYAISKLSKNSFAGLSPNEPVTRQCYIPQKVDSLNCKGYIFR